MNTFVIRIWVPPTWITYGLLFFPKLIVEYGWENHKNLDPNYKQEHNFSTRAF